MPESTRELKMSMISKSDNQGQRMETKSPSKHDGRGSRESTSTEVSAIPELGTRIASREIREEGQ